MISRPLTACLAWVSVCVLASAVQAADPPAYAFHRLSPEHRARLDAVARATPYENGRLDVQLETYGDIAAWAVSRAPLPNEEALRRAEAIHVSIQQQSQLDDAPAAAKRILKRLVDELPPRMRETGFPYQLFVLDELADAAFTTGAGRIYLSRAALDALQQDEEHAESRLAFTLAQQLGHLCREHVQRRYQLLWLSEQLQERLENEVHSRRVQELLNQSLDHTGRWLTFLYRDEETYKADLFALHLCRNAGFDPEICLDAVRERIVALARDDLSQSVPSTEPELPRDVRRHLQRLKRLRAELDGEVPENGYGLFTFDPVAEATSSTESVDLSDGERAIVFIHGMESDVAIFAPLAAQLAKDLSARTFVMRYPNDGSLARSGRFLTSEMRRVFSDPDQVDFVCHSAGGLVFRWYAEVEQAPFRTAILMGTPNTGSNLARLRALLEINQLIGDFDLGYTEALEKSLLDAKGEIGFDLQPGSLCLRYLNRDHESKREMQSRYRILRGQLLSRRAALGLKASFLAGRLVASRQLDQWTGPELVRRIAREQLDELDLPEELVNGDLAVTTQSAALNGVSEIATLKVSHTKLPTDPAAIELVSAWMAKPE